MQDPMTLIFAGLLFTMAFLLVLAAAAFSSMPPSKSTACEAKRAEESPEEKLKRELAEWWYSVLSSGERYRPGTFQEFISCVGRYREHFTAAKHVWYDLCGTSMIRHNSMVVIKSDDPMRFMIAESSAMFDGVLFLFETLADYSLYSTWYNQVKHGKIIPFPGRRATGTWASKGK